MTTLADLVTRLRDLLQDPSGAGQHWSDSFLQGCVARGNEALYPRAYEPKTDTSLVTVSGQVEYTLPSAIPTKVGFSALRQVYLAQAAGTVAAPDVVYGWRVDSGRGKLVLWQPLAAGRALHLVYMARLNSLNAGTDTFGGSSAAEAAVLSWAEAEALGELRRTSLRDKQYTEAAREFSGDEFREFEMLLRPGLGAWMQPLPLLR
jgi:hypothetical protein